jgi:lipopolysaccharide biosynthesis regulator YciM
MGQAKGSPLMIYEFAPNQTAPEALTRLADWQQENGNLPAAAGLLTTALKADPENLPALIAAARVDLANGAQAQFAQIVQRLKVVAVLDDQLELEDRVRLAAIFNAVNDNNDFQRELTAALRQLDAKNLRKLRQESLYALLMLSAKTGQLEQRPGLLPYVTTLLELNWRVKFLQDYSDMEKNAGHPREAVALLRRALGTAPRSLMTLDRLAWLLATSPDSSVRNGKEAVEFARQAREIDQGQHVNITDTLACALAENGEFAEAISLETLAIKIAENAKATTVANILRTHLVLFNSQLPYREASPKTSVEPN